MRQTFLRHTDGNDSLMLFFAGWGAEPCMFAEPESGMTAGRLPYDILFCWDYRSMDFDMEVPRRYGTIRILAWSMGVSMAGRLLAATSSGHDISPLVTDSLAVCGTPFPIDDQRGIPKAIFDGTADGLSDRSMAKFRRRMCGSSEALDQLLSSGLTRTTEELREELLSIRDAVLECSDVESAACLWRRAIVGTEDMIFPASNQRRAWESLGVPYVISDMPHYETRLFRQLLYQQDSWTRL